MTTKQDETRFDTVGESEMVSRRDAITSAAVKSCTVATVLGIGAIPVALAALVRTAEAQTAKSVTDALQYVLLIVQMQAELHLRATSVSGFVPTADLSAMSGMRDQDSAQEQAIGALISSLNTVPNDKPTFDWTAKGAFPGFNFASGQYATYQMIVQGLEDTGVRAIKGQILRMTANTDALTQIARYASVQARHAAEIRRIRGQKGWVTGNTRNDLPAIFQPAYDGEEVTVHDGFDSAALASANGGTAAVTEAFDEPLTNTQADVVISKFLA
jgi:hypothetical protein